jgi:hypothetical protein
MKKTQPKPETTPAAAPVSVPQPAPEVPDWANDTPYETLYTIEMWQQEIVETIDLTRAEYIALKQHLATMRGLSPSREIPQIAEPAESETAPQTALDPMHCMLSNLSPEQQQEIHGALLSRLHGRLSNMSTWEIRSLLWYADIEEAGAGCDKPAEEFITNLVLHQSIRPLTPDDAASKLEEFRENFDNMVTDVRAFTARYPEAFKSATAA